MNKAIKLFFTVMIVFVGFGLSGCDIVDQSPVTSISVDATTIQNLNMGNFNMSDIKVVLHKADGSTQSIALTAAMLSETDIKKMSIAGTHTITVKYGTHQTTLEVTIQGTELELRLSAVYLLGVTSSQITSTYDEWLASITGAQGVGIQQVAINSNGNLIITLTNSQTIDAGKVVGPAGQTGKQIQLQTNETHLQWKLEDGAQWMNLIELAVLKGTDGTSGLDGEDGVGIKTVTINLLGELIISFDDNTEVNLGVVVGKDGINGINGKDGEQGISMTNATINPTGQLIITLSNEQTLNVGNVIGPKGVDGKEIELRTNVTHIQWRYIGVETWTDLVALTNITGPQGMPGTDGKEVELRTNATHIQWKYVNNSTWTDLISLSSLIGQTGPSGINGKEIELRTNVTHIQWRYIGDTTWINLIELTLLVGPQGNHGSNGIDGKEVEFRTNTTHIQWKYVGDSTWFNLISLSTLVGQTGPSGVDGKEIELRTNTTHIQWRYIGDTNWINLIELSMLVGPQGTTGADGLHGINGREIEIDVIENAIKWRYIDSNDWTTLLNLSDIVPPTISVVVTFAIDGGTLPEPFTSVMTINKGDSMILPIPTKEGFIFKGWFTGTTVNDSQFFNFIPFSQDITLQAKWEEDQTDITTFDVYFMNNDEIMVSILDIVGEINVTKPNDPSLEGHVFIGWNTNPYATTGLSFPRLVQQATIFYAIWAEEQVITSDNHFYLTQKSQTETQLQVEVWITGEPNIAGYDMRVYYDSNKLLAFSIVNGVSNVYNMDVPGEVRFNFADVMSPIRIPRLLMTITFNKINIQETQTILDLVVIQATEIDDNYNLSIAETSTAGITINLS